MLKISVIIPIYNNDKYIKKCLDSVLNQDFKEFEVIIINDGSTDNSKAICEKYASKDSRVRLINIKNSGVSNARNIGLQNARGEYIQFIDSDDYIDKNMFKELYNISLNTNADVIISGITKINIKTKNSKEVLPISSGLYNKKEVLNNFELEQRKTGLYGYVSNKFIKASIINKYKIKFDTTIKLAEDLDFYLRLYNNTNNIYLHNKSYYYYYINYEKELYNKVNYFTQISISLKEKKLLDENKCLNNKNKNQINLIITNFCLCFLYDEFSWTYFETKKKFKMLAKNDEIVKSFSYSKMKFFEKIILFLIANEIYFITFMMLSIRKICETIYRFIKYKIINKYK